MLVVVSAAAACEALHFPVLTLSVFGVLVAFYTVVVHGSRRQVQAAAVMVAFVIMILVSIHPRPGPGSGLLSYRSIMGTTWAFARNVRARREQAVELERRAPEPGEARQELARQAVDEERLPIARELHDVVAQSVSVIGVHSGAGRHVLGTQPDDAGRG